MNPFKNASWLLIKCNKVLVNVGHMRGYNIINSSTLYSRICLQSTKKQPQGYLNMEFRRHPNILWKISNFSVIRWKFESSISKPKSCWNWRKMRSRSPISWLTHQKSTNGPQSSWENPANSLQIRPYKKPERKYFFFSFKVTINDTKFCPRCIDTSWSKRKN